MYNPELDNLIDLALADGELTEKEKQILFKRAESYGVDLDEFEMVLEAKLFNKTKEKKEAAPQSNKYGDVKKCPACPAIISPYATKCADCGYDFQNVDANASVNKLFEMLNELESKRNDPNANPLKSFATEMFKDVMGGDKVDRQKRELISNFPIPTTKGDLIEFLTLALPKAKIAGNFLTKNSEQNKVHNEFVPVWKGKCEQIIMKARFSMKDDPNTLQQIEKYASEIGIK